MRLSYLRLRLPFDRVPDASGVFNEKDVFEHPAYELTEQGAWVRMKHVESGKQVMVPSQVVLVGVPMGEQQQGQPGLHKHGGQKR